MDYIQVRVTKKDKKINKDNPSYSQPGAKCLIQIPLANSQSYDK